VSKTLQRWAEMLRCPVDACPLRVAGVPRSTDEAGYGCASCGRLFPVAQGILRCLDAAPLADGAQADEMRARDADADQFESNFTDRQSALEIPPFLRAMRPMADDAVLDLGCGTGRVTLRYARWVRRIVAVDFSLHSLLVLRRKIAPELTDRFLLIQADIAALPLAPHSFTQAISFAVFEHLPTAELRRRAAAAAARQLVPGGTFTCAVYHWSKRKRREAARGIGDDTRKEGFHDSNIYYYNFEGPEFRELLEAAGLRVELLRGLVIGFRGGRFLGPCRSRPTDSSPGPAGGFGTAITFWPGPGPVSPVGGPDPPGFGRGLAATINPGFPGPWRE
jgi:SAM-dependent methyltransferase